MSKAWKDLLEQYLRKVNLIFAQDSWRYYHNIFTLSLSSILEASPMWPPKDEENNASIFWKSISWLRQQMFQYINQNQNQNRHMNCFSWLWKKREKEQQPQNKPEPNNNTFKRRICNFKISQHNSAPIYTHITSYRCQSRLMLHQDSIHNDNDDVMNSTSKSHEIGLAQCIHSNII